MALMGEMSLAPHVPARLLFSITVAAYRASTSPAVWRTPGSIAEHTPARMLPTVHFTWAERRLRGGVGLLNTGTD